MEMEKAAPCRHAGAPPASVVKLTMNAIRSVASDREFLARNGLTEAEFASALPTAIQKIRGSAAASNSERREFLTCLFDGLKDAGIIAGYIRPDYGDDTVYELDVPGVGKVAIIQKGCPDGIHSSVKWSRPEWADEAYLWWLCDSLSYEPGEHVAKGVNRLRNRFFDQDYRDAVDGVIFHNSLCGTPMRPCPKIAKASRIGEVDIPPPCIWVMPERVDLEGGGKMEWNWDGARDLGFPRALLSLFGISEDNCAEYIGNVGFKRHRQRVRTTIASRFGEGRMTNYRSDAR